MNNSSEYYSGYGRSGDNQQLEERQSKLRVWKKLHSPAHTARDPFNPYRMIYNHQPHDLLMKEVFFIFYFKQSKNRLNFKFIFIRKPLVF